MLVSGRTSLEIYCERNNIALEDFNEDIEVIEGCTDVNGLLEGCESFNSNIYLPDSVQSMRRMLKGCPNYNKHIKLPAQALDCSQMFDGCYGFNKPIRLPDTLRNTYKMFYNCVSLEGKITLPHSITNYEAMFTGTSVEPQYPEDFYDYDKLFMEIEDNEEATDLEVIEPIQFIKIDKFPKVKLDRRSFKNGKSKLGNRKGQTRRSKRHSEDPF